MFAAWVAYPLVMLLLSVGAGELVERASGRELTAALRIPCGLVLIIVVLDLLTRTTTTASYAVPAALAIGVGGLGLAVSRRPRRGRPVAGSSLGAGLRALRRAPAPAAVAGLVVFAAYAAPVVLSGRTTWLGYMKLDDTSIWLAIVDQALAHGRTISDLGPSTFWALLDQYLTVGYPIGAFLPLGIGHTVLGTDIAWLTNPWMAFCVAMLALALSALALRLLPQARGWLIATIATGGALSTLLYGYYLWGGEKEIVGALLIAVAALTIPLPFRGERRLRAAVPAVLTIWALIAAESPGGLVWIGPGGLIVIALLLIRARLLGTLDLSWRPRPFAVAVAGAGGAAVATDAQAAEPDAETAPPKRAAAAAGKPAAAATSPKKKQRVGASRQQVAAMGRRGRASRPARRQPVDPLEELRARALAHARRAAGGWARVRALPTAVRTVAALAIAIALGLFVVLRAGGFVTRFRGVLTGGTQLGVLPHSLNAWQLAGIWPSGDFRYDPAHMALTYALIAVAIAAAIGALAYALRRGVSEPLCYLLFAVAGGVLGVAFASPWIAGKALASASPALPFCALLAAGLLLSRRARFRGAAALGAVVLVLVGGGIVWGDALGYHDARMAPHALMASLEDIAPRIAGQGPTLMTEYQVYGVRHFLRDALPEDPGDSRTRTDALLNGTRLPKSSYADLDDLPLASSLQYRTIVLQRSPVTTRPPAPYVPIYSDRYWQVWQRPATLDRQIFAYIPIGDLTSTYKPAGVADCKRVLSLGRAPQVTQLVAAPAVNPIIVNAAAGRHPAAWTNKTLLSMHGNGSATIPISVPTAGRYRLWLRGSMQNATTLSVDGRIVGTVSNAMQQSGQFSLFGSIRLSAGHHTVTLRHHTNVLVPGSGQSDLVGPLAISPAVPPPPLITVAPSQARSLCGRQLSWIEAYE